MRIRSFLRPVKRIAYSAITAFKGDSQGFTSVRPLRGPGKDLRFRLNLRSGFEDGYFQGSYDLDILSRLAKVVQPGWTVWECGVYIGYYTNIFAKWVGPRGKVVAIEPNPNNRSRAMEHCAKNGFQNVTFLPYAVGDGAGTVPFFTNDNTNSHLPGVYVGSSQSQYATVERQESIISVRCVSLGQLLDEKDVPVPQFIKIDIEGAELLALPNAARLASSVRPVICLELHNPDCDRAAWNFAQKFDYILESLDTGRPLSLQEDVSGTLLCRPKEGTKA